MVDLRVRGKGSCQRPVCFVVCREALISTPHRNRLCSAGISLCTFVVDLMYALATLKITLQVLLKNP